MPWRPIADTGVGFSFSSADAVMTGSTIDNSGVDGAWTLSLSEAATVRVSIQSWAFPEGGVDSYFEWNAGASTQANESVLPNASFSPPVIEVGVLEAGVQLAFFDLSEGSGLFSMLVELFVPDSMPLIQVSYSDDGGRNYSNWREVSLGAVGEYETRQRLRRLGAARQRIWRIQTAAPLTVNVLGAVAYAELTEG